MTPDRPPRPTLGLALLLVGALCPLAPLPAQGAPALLRGPYLQIATPTSIRVRWRTDVAAASRLRWRVAGTPTWSEVTSALAVTEHEVPLAGLPPATVHEYEPGHDLGWFGTVATFRTAPPAGTPEPVRIWVIGDSGTANANARRVRDAYLGFAGSRRTDVWLMLGDNAYSSGTDAEYQGAVFENMYEALLVGTPLWPTLGNHDGLSASSVTLTGPYYDIFSLPSAGEAGGLPSGTEAWYSFDHANVHFVCLDSHDSDRTPTGPMATWLAADLAATTQEWIIAYWHHPPYSRGSHDSDLEGRLIEMRTFIVPILEAGGVDLVLCGHSHSYERSVLLDGHHGLSTSYVPAVHARDAGDGDQDGDGAYRKPSLPGTGGEGAVFAVAGSSGTRTVAPLDHPVMVRSLYERGSLVLDVQGAQLDGRFLQEDGVLLDRFTITKGGAGALPRDHRVVDEGTSWRYEDSGTDPGPAWRQPGYDDSSWSLGVAPLGYGEPWIATTVSFGPDPAQKHRTTYFRRSFALPFDPVHAVAARAWAVWDDGFVLHLNGVEVARRNLPPGPIDGQTLASSHEAVGYEPVNLGAALPLLVAGTNVLAIEVHQTSDSSSDLAWDLRLEIEGLVPPLHDGAAGVAGAADLLTIGGSTGGFGRTVLRAPGEALDVDLASPATGAAPFVLLGRLGPVAGAVPLPLGPGVGTLCFAPAFLPAADAGTFTLASGGLPVPGALFTGATTPWSLTLPGGLPTPLELLFQGVVETAPGDLRVTNAVRLIVTP